MKIKKPFHVHDATMKYASMAFRKRQHQYFGLPGDYLRRYPTEVVLRNMETGRMDELYSTREGFLIDMEDESGPVSEKTLKKFSKYKVFGSFIYSMPMITAVICHQDPKNFPKEYEYSPTDILRPIYIYIPQEELWEKYQNINNKVTTNMELDENEALDIAFIPRLIEKEHGAYICESLAGIFKKAKIPDKELKMDVAVILMTMILNYIPDKTKQEELLEVMKMKVYKDDMEELVYSIYGKELSKKDNTIQQQGNTIQQQGNQLKQKDNTIQQQGNQLKQKDKEIIEMKKNYNKLAKIDNLPPEAKKIINSMFNAK